MQLGQPLQVPWKASLVELLLNDVCWVAYHSVVFYEKLRPPSSAAVQHVAVVNSKARNTLSPGHHVSA